MSQRILSNLPQDDYDRLVPSLQPVSLLSGEVIYEPSGPLHHVYFPTACVISLLYTMENGTDAEMGLVGNDGVVGVALFLGGSTTPNRAVVQIAGHALRISASVLRQEFSRFGALHDGLLRYTQVLITQISQTAVCNRLHSVDQRLCRWLLLSHDRLDSDKLEMTHDLISKMLGVRREGVTLAAQKLAKRGLIKNVRGAITIL